MKMLGLMAFVALGAATPAAAVRYEIFAQGTLVAAPATANPLMGLPFGTGATVLARWTFDLDAATAIDLPSPGNPAIGQARVFNGTFRDGEIGIFGTGGSAVALVQNARSLGSLFVLNDTAPSPNPNLRNDQVTLSDGVSYVDGLALPTYDSLFLPQGVYLASVTFGRVENTMVPVLPGLVNSVDAPDLPMLFSNTVNLFGLNFRSGDAASAQAAAALPSARFNVINPFVQVFAIAVPEPSSWAMLIAGFGLVGAAMRRRVRQSDGGRGRFGMAAAGKPSY